MSTVSKQEVARAFNVDFKIITDAQKNRDVSPAPPHMLESPLRANLVRLSDDCVGIPVPVKSSFQPHKYR